MNIESYELYDCNLKNIKIFKNKINIITGPNGVGKTQLLLAIRENIGEANFLSLSSYLLKNLTLEENISIWRKKYTLNEELLELLKINLNLSNFMSMKINRLSTGTKRKIELALFLSKNNNVLLIDEPLSFLDEKSISNIIMELEKQVSYSRYIIIADQSIEAYNKYVTMESISEIKLEDKC